MASRIAALFREQAGNLFSGHEVILDMIVDRVAGRDWETIPSPSDDILRELEVMDLRLDDESAIVVVDAAGKLRATTVHVQPNEPQPTADQYCFLALRKNEVESCISQPHTDPGSGRYLFTLSRRLEKDGAFNGIAQVAISADYIVDLWASAAPNSSDIVTMFKADGTILAQSRLQSETAPRLPDVGKTLIGKVGQDKVGHHPGAFVDRRRRLDHRLYQGSQEPGLYQPQPRQKRDPVDLACQSDCLWSGRSECHSRHPDGTWHRIATGTERTRRRQSVAGRGS